MSCYDCKHGPKPCNRWKEGFDDYTGSLILLCQDSKDYLDGVNDIQPVHPTITQDDFAKCEAAAEMELNRILDENG